MTSDKRTRPRTFGSALAWWPNAMAAVQDDPCDVTLQQLCVLLDVMDGEIVRMWEGDGHDYRLSVLAECRAAARQANALVAAAGLARAKARGRVGQAARKAKKEAEVAA